MIRYGDRFVTSLRHKLGLRLRVLIRDLRMYYGLWYRIGWLRLYAGFSRFERVKKFIAMGLYRQRGRFARPFVHSAMGGLMAMGIVLAPVLANSFPGTGGTTVEDVSPTEQVIQVTDAGMTTEISDKVRDKVIEYVVQSGDTASGIADKFGISTDTIRWENNLTSINQIKPNQKLRILPVSGVKHKVQRGETIYSIAKKYNANPQAVVDYPFNTFTDNESFALAVGQELIVPDGERPNEIPWSPPRQPYLAKTPDAGAVSATGQFVWPISGKITQRYTFYHRGVDIATAMGTPVLAADSGTVRAAGWFDNSGYGMQVVIDHGNGLSTRYAHLSKVLVSTGQRVNRRDVIGLEGSTGRSTGPHLHFEIMRGGARLNPFDYLK